MAKYKIQQEAADVEGPQGIMLRHFILWVYFSLLQSRKNLGIVFQKGKTNKDADISGKL